MKRMIYEVTDFVSHDLLNIDSNEFADYEPNVLTYVGNTHIETLERMWEQQQVEPHGRRIKGNKR